MRKTRKQKGSLKRVRRDGGTEVWVFRWREYPADGSVRPRKLVIGTTQQFRSEAAAWQRIPHLGLAIHSGHGIEPCPRTFEELVRHFQSKELPEREDPDGEGRAFSTKDNYRYYLRNWIVPKWGEYELDEVKAVAVEDWLRNLRLRPTRALPEGKKASRGTRKKIRDLMHLIYEHAIRYEWISHNPITSVRQSGRREKEPEILEVDELAKLLASLEVRERIAVFLDFGTGARLGELQGLKWEDFDFVQGAVWMKRSIVKQRIGKVKTEASERPIPLSPSLIEDLLAWRGETLYANNTDYLFASPVKRGKQPYWMSRIMQHVIKPAARRVGITKNIGWHTLRRTYASLLQDHNEDPKVVQELLRHASIKVTMDVYTQALTHKKRRAQSNVVEMVAAKQRSLQPAVAPLKVVAAP
jgi:integrase